MVNVVPRTYAIVKMDGEVHGLQNRALNQTTRCVPVPVARMNVLTKVVAFVVRATVNLGLVV